MTLEIKPIITPVEIIQSASSLLAEFGNGNPHLEKLMVGCAAEAETLRGENVELTILMPGENADIDSNNLNEGINMGRAQFGGFIRTESGWLADFTLEPEKVPCPVNVELVRVEEHSS